MITVVWASALLMLFPGMGLIPLSDEHPGTVANLGEKKLAASDWRDHRDHLPVTVLQQPFYRSCYTQADQRARDWHNYMAVTQYWHVGAGDCRQSEYVNIDGTLRTNESQRPIRRRSLRQKNAFVRQWSKRDKSISSWHCKSRASVIY